MLIHSNKLLFQVYSCVCTLVVYKDSIKAGIVELRGSNGEKAYCFFLARVSHFILLHFSESLKHFFSQYY